MHVSRPPTITFENLGNLGRGKPLHQVRQLSRRLAKCLLRGATPLTGWSCSCLPRCTQSIPSGAHGVAGPARLGYYVLPDGLHISLTASQTGTSGFGRGQLPGAVGEREGERGEVLRTMYSSMSCAIRS